MESVGANMSQETYRQIWHSVYYYYIRHPRLTHKEIAERLRISRPTVSRHLQMAEQMGLIKISAFPPRHTDAEVRLTDRFGLRDARVIPVPEGDVASISRVLGYAAGEYLEQLLADFYRINPGRPASIALGGGGSVYDTVQALKPGLFKGLEIYPLVGGPRSPLTITAAENVSIMYSKYSPRSARFHELYPSINKDADSSVIADNILQKIRHVDFALIGIGNISESSTLGKNLKAFGFDLDQLKERGFVADICSRLLYSEGEYSDLSIHDQLIGISLDHLRDLHKKEGKRVIAISGGRGKLQAIKAALNGGGQGPYADTLITDETTAWELIGP